MIRLLAFSAVALIGCGARSLSDGGPDASGPPCRDESIPAPRLRYCGLGPGHVECGTCGEGEWCDQVNGVCRDELGPCDRCAGGCTLNGRCTAAPCEGRCDETVLVPAGDAVVQIGADVRTEWMDVFRIGRFEVTILRYRECIEAAVCGEPHWDDVGQHVNGALWDPSFDGFPVSGVYARDAAAFCEWDGGRLPTFGEWTKAARGGCEVRGTAECEKDLDSPRYPWGEGPPDCDKANFTFDREAGDYCAGRPERVGSYPDGASPYGVEDTVGNVVEWASGEGCRDGDFCHQATDWFSPLSGLSVAYWNEVDGDHEGAAGFRCAYPP